MKARVFRMIPAFNQAGVLPPFLPGCGPTTSAAMAPYQTRMIDVVKRFAHSKERVDLVNGLLEYRKSLRTIGITSGFQWINGSYVEKCEENRGCPPKDIDVVTFVERPANCIDDNSWVAFLNQNKQLIFDRGYLKTQYKCDAFFEDLGLPSRVVVSKARFWFGLFSHQRTSYLWKGLLEIPINVDDNDAFDLLKIGSINAS